jgi:hypothetical protein
MSAVRVHGVANGVGYVATAPRSGVVAAPSVFGEPGGCRFDTGVVGTDGLPELLEHDSARHAPPTRHASVRNERSAVRTT